MKDAHSAKREMLARLSKEMAKSDDGGLGDMLKGKKMEKVMVASDSPEGLEKGLNKAQEILSKRKEIMGGEEMLESPEEEMEEECEEESPEEIKAKIAELQAKLARK